MLYNYVALVFFAAIALAVPYSMLLTAKLLRHKAKGNMVKNAPYESAEATTGKNRDVLNEYLPYFIMFLPLEVVSVILLLWSAASRAVPYLNSIAVMGIAVMSMAFAVAGFMLIRGKNAGR